METDLNFKDKTDLLNYIRLKLAKYPPILSREFKSIDDAERPKTKENEFRLMTWNLLARALGDGLDTGSKAPPAGTYDWEKFRKWRTLEELVRHDCDILSVEEVDFYEDIKPYLHSIGYTSVFCPKFKSPCLDFENNHGPDGSALFFRKSVFQIQNMSCEKIPTRETAAKSNEDNQPMPSVLFDSQVLIIAELKHLSSGQHVTVVSVHLKSKAANHAKRAEQAEYMLDVVGKHVKASLRSRDIGNHPVIMCGDFNGEPFEKFYSSIVEAQEFGFRDAYSNLQQMSTSSTNSKQPTSIKFREGHQGLLKRAIDYVFYRPVGLQLTEFLELPEANDPRICEQGLPNLAYSSDHLALACGFRFLPIE